MYRTKKETTAQALARKENLPYGLSAIDGNFYAGATTFLQGAGVATIWEPYSENPALTAPEIAAVLARLADLWRGSDEAPAIRSVACDLGNALQGKCATFDKEAFWRACRIDPEDFCPSCEKRRRANPCEHCGHVEDDKACQDEPAPAHLDPDPPGGVVVTADREDGGPVVVERIGR